MVMQLSIFVYEYLGWALLDMYRFWQCRGSQRTCCSITMWCASTAWIHQRCFQPSVWFHHLCHSSSAARWLHFHPNWEQMSLWCPSCFLWVMPCKDRENEDRKEWSRKGCWYCWYWSRGLVPVQPGLMFLECDEPVKSGATASEYVKRGFFHLSLVRCGPIKMSLASWNSSRAWILVGWKNRQRSVTS